MSPAPELTERQVGDDDHRAIRRPRAGVGELRHDLLVGKHGLGVPRPEPVAAATPPSLWAALATTDPAEALRSSPSASRPCPAASPRAVGVSLKVFTEQGPGGHSGRGQRVVPPSSVRSPRSEPGAMVVSAGWPISSASIASVDANPPVILPIRTPAPGVGARRRFGAAGVDPSRCSRRLWGLAAGGLGPRWASHAGPFSQPGVRVRPFEGCAS